MHQPIIGIAFRPDLVVDGVRRAELNPCFYFGGKLRVNVGPERISFQIRIEDDTLVRKLAT